MTKSEKIVMWIVLILLGLWLLFPIVRILLGLEFSNDDYKSNYKQFLFYAIPVVILISLYATVKENDSLASKIIKVISTTAIAGGALIVMIMSLWTDMCVWSDRQTLYELKKNANIKIMVRDFGCGATDSGPPVVHIFKVRYFTKYFIQASKIDTAKINKDEWAKIE